MSESLIYNLMQDIFPIVDGLNTKNASLEQSTIQEDLVQEATMPAAANDSMNPDYEIKEEYLEVNNLHSINHDSIDEIIKLVSSMSYHGRQKILQRLQIAQNNGQRSSPHSISITDQLNSRGEVSSVS